MDDWKCKPIKKTGAVYPDRPRSERSESNIPKFLNERAPSTHPRQSSRTHPSYSPLSSYASSEGRKPTLPRAGPKSNKICSSTCQKPTPTAKELGTRSQKMLKGKTERKERGVSHSRDTSSIRSPNPSSTSGLHRFIYRKFSPQSQLGFPSL